MAQKINDTFVVNAGGHVVYLAHIKGADGADITIATISSISRVITDTVGKTVTTDTPVVADTVFDTLQTNLNLWDQQYNFLDEMVFTKVPLRRRYTLQYTFTASGGEVFKTREVDVEGD